MARQLCVECGQQPKKVGRHRCWECWLRHEPMGVQVEFARLRLERVPPDERIARVPKEKWPKGRRWCAGCQTFVSLKDVAPGASRCRPCNSGTAHAAQIQKKYNISAEDYNALLRRQGGRCGICRQRPVQFRLAVDHDHETGVVRGLLCSRCNHDLLGAAHDSVKILQNALAYMKHPPTSDTWKIPEAKKSDPGPPPF